MGNTPTQELYEGDSSDPEGAARGASFRRRLVGAVRSVYRAVRRSLSGFSNTDPNDSIDDGNGGTSSGDTAKPAVRRHGRHPLPVDRSPDEGVSTLPPRDIPFTHPARDADVANEPDLVARESAGRLSIYYPDEADAEITSDTWESVER